jgi:hypothetical protein
MPTLTDLQCISTFVNELRFNVFGKWMGQTEQQRAASMHAAVTRAHKLCGVPATTAEISDLGRSTQGLFQFAAWKLQLNTSLFPDAEMDLNNIHPYFVYVAEVVYHEARHCEQWWHMARLVAGNARSGVFLAQTLNRPDLRTLQIGSPALAQAGAQHIATTMFIPRNIAHLALQQPMGGADPLLNLTKAWYKSVYGESNRGIVLRGLALQRKSVPGEAAVLLQDFHANMHRTYSGQLPEEVDAWGIMPAVRAAFGRSQRP